MLLKCRKQPGNCQNMLESVLLMVFVKELEVFSVIWRMDSKGQRQLNFAGLTGYISVHRSLAISGVNEASMHCKLTIYVKHHINNAHN